MDNFKSFITEDKHENYRVVVISNELGDKAITAERIEEEAKKPEVKPEASPVVETTKASSDDTIPEKDMQAEIDNDLNKKDVEDVADETSSTLKKISETEAKTEKTAVKNTVEQ